MKYIRIHFDLNTTINLVWLLPCVYSLVNLPIIIFNESFPTEAAEEGELPVVLPFVSVPVPLQVEGLTTNCTNELFIFSLTYPMS